MTGSPASTVVFVHGAHFAGWCWLLVMEQLGRRGIRCRALDLPFTGYQEDVATVRSAVRAARSEFGAVHVVAHSYGGLPVTEAAHRADHLTFVAGRLPLPHESPAEETHRWRSPGFDAGLLKGEDGSVNLGPEAGPHLFHRTDPTLAEFAMERVRPMTSAVPDRPVTDPAWMTVPSSYVVCTDDRAVRPEAQQARAALVDAHVELDTDHSPFLSGAVPLAEFLADRHREVTTP